MVKKLHHRAVRHDLEIRAVGGTTWMVGSRAVAFGMGIWL